MPAWMQQLNGMQLTPEQLAQLNQQFGGTYGATTQSGFDIAPMVQYGQGEDGAGINNILGYTGVPQGTDWNNITNDDWYGGFDTKGKFEGARHPHEFDMGDATPFLFALAAGAAAMAPAAAAGAGAGAAEAGAVGGAGGAGGAGSGFAFNAAVDSQLANASLGLGSVGGATAPAVAGGLGSGAGSLAGAAGDASLMNGLNGADIMSDAFVSNGGYGAGGFGGTNGSYMSNLLSGTGNFSDRLMGGTGAGSTSGAGSAISTAAKAAGGSSNLLGAGASLLGALTGAKGQEQESTSVRDIQEWLKPFVQKNLGYASGLLDKQMAPGYMQGYDDMRTKGQNLLSQPIAGNGFSRFFPGK